MENNIQIDKSWTLFLDRDGVIHKKRENDYVKKWSEFSFMKGSLDAISKLSKIFGRIIVVTNQRGVGKDLMQESELNEIHERMLEMVTMNFGKIDKVYFCADVNDEAECRKPNTRMAVKAKIDFPDIDFKKSMMIGDSMSDILFGKKFGMIYYMISSNINLKDNPSNPSNFQSLYECAKHLSMRDLVLNKGNFKKPNEWTF